MPAANWRGNRPTSATSAARRHLAGRRLEKAGRAPSPAEARGPIKFLNFLARRPSRREKLAGRPSPRSKSRGSAFARLRGDNEDAGEVIGSMG